MHRLFDWECPRGHKQEALVAFAQGTAAPRTTTLQCHWCRGEVPHTRLMPLTAKYLYDRPASPQVFGGRFDTMGFKQAPQLPPIPEGLTQKDAGDVMMSREVGEVVEARKALRKENARKKQRSRAGVDFRSHRLPGDPKI